MNDKTFIHQILNQLLEIYIVIDMSKHWGWHGNADSFTSVLCKVYEEMAANDRERYAREMKDWVAEQETPPPHLLRKWGSESWSGSLQSLYFAAAEYIVLS